MAAVSGVSISNQTGAAHQKLERAAHEFEAILLNSLLGSLEQTFSDLPGKKTDSSSDHYHFLGMQALSSSLARGGGLGIASLIMRSLARSAGQQPASAHEKSPTRGASLGRPF